MNVNLYGRARRLALYRNIFIIVASLVAIIILICLIFGGNEQVTISNEFDLLRNHFVNKGYSCEMLNVSGSKCISNTDNVKTTFYRFDDGFEYNVKSSSYSLVIIHRLDKKDEISFKTTSEAFTGFKNQNFICEYENNVLDPIKSCEDVDEDIELSVKSYLGVIEQAQQDITNAINSSGFSLENVLVSYEWIKK